MNSLRARGVMSFQASSAVGLATSASRRSAGSWCTTPPGTREALTDPRYRPYGSVPAVSLAVVLSTPATIWVALGGSPAPIPLTFRPLSSTHPSIGTYCSTQRHLVITSRPGGRWAQPEVEVLACLRGPARSSRRAPARWSKMRRNRGKLGSMTEADSSGDTQYRKFLREFLYVDVGRVRSYLAQLTEGLPERVSEASDEGSTTDTGLKVSGLGVDRAAIRATRSEDTRTYGDLLGYCF